MEFSQFEYVVNEQRCDYKDLKKGMGYESILGAIVLPVSLVESGSIYSEIPKTLCESS